MKTAKWLVAAVVATALLAGCAGNVGAGDESATGSAGEALVSKKDWSSIGCITGDFDGSDVMVCTRESVKLAPAAAINVEAVSATQEIFKTSAYLIKESDTLAVYQGDIAGIYDTLKEAPQVPQGQVLGGVTIERKTNPPRGVYQAILVAPCGIGKTCINPLKIQ